MEISVLYFAATRDLSGVGDELLVVPPDTTVEGALALIGARHVRLAGHLTRVRVARNESFARLDEVLSAGDVLALIPPVSGG